MVSCLNNNQHVGQFVPNLYPILAYKWHFLGNVPFSDTPIWIGAWPQLQGIKGLHPHPDCIMDLAVAHRCRCKSNVARIRCNRVGLQGTFFCEVVEGCMIAPFTLSFGSKELWNNSCDAVRGQKQLDMSLEIFEGCVWVRMWETGLLQLVWLVQPCAMALHVPSLQWTLCRKRVSAVLILGHAKKNSCGQPLFWNNFGLISLIIVLVRARRWQFSDAHSFQLPGRPERAVLGRGRSLSAVHHSLLVGNLKSLNVDTELRNMPGNSNAHWSRRHPSIQDDCCCYCRSSVRKSSKMSWLA